MRRRHGERRLVLRRTGSFLLGALALTCPRAAHADPQDIEEGEPVTLEDAFTDPAGQLSLQYSGSFTRMREGGTTDLLQDGPTIKLGAFKGVQISVNPNYATGTAPGHDTGSALGDVLVQLNAQGVVVPAFAVDVFYAVPFGAGHKSADYVVRLLASKSLGAAAQAPRLDLNLTDYHLTQPDRDGRKDQLELAAGGSMELGNHDAMVADVVYGAAEQAGQSETLLEIGYNRDLPDDWSMNVGVGKQVRGAADALRLYFAVEKELQIF